MSSFEQGAYFITSVRFFTHYVIGSLVLDIPPRRYPKAQNRTSLRVGSESGYTIETAFGGLSSSQFYGFGLEHA
jgi:hypothetical protein